jgi:hypothetical protein
MTNRTGKKLWPLTVLALALSCACADGNENKATLSTAEITARIEADPRIIDGARLDPDYFNGVMVKNLRLRNVTLKNMDISNLTFINPVFDNVIFENCTITAGKFLGGRFSNVTFNGGRLTYDKNAGHLNSITLFELCEIDRLSFDKTTMQAARLYNMKGGSIIFRNMQEFSDYNILKIESSNIADFAPSFDKIVTGSVKLVVENCTVKEAPLAKMQSGRVYIIKSRLLNSGLGGKLFLYMTDSLLDGGTNIRIGGDTAVIKNSVLGKFDFFSRGEAYVINNNYRSESNAVPSLRAGKLYAADNDIPYLQAFGEEVTIENMDTQRLTYLTVSDNPATLNLHNVNIKNLDLRYGVNIGGGWWENVSIGDVRISVAGGDIINIDGVAAYNFHDSKQFLNFAPPIPYNVRIMEEPFIWPEVKVPTAQELGF